MADIAKPRTPLWLRLTLLGSLALNLLVIGAVAGAVVFGGSEHRTLRDRGDPAPVFIRALDPADRRALRQDLLENLRDTGRDRGGMIEDFRTSLAALRETPFDAEGFAALLADHSARRAQRDAIGRAALAQRIAAMSDAERAAYAARIEDSLEKMAERVRR